VKPPELEPPKPPNLKPTPDFPVPFPVVPPAPPVLTPKLEAPPPTPEKRPPTVTAAAQPPAPPQRIESLSTGTDARNLLALSPFPLPPDSKVSIPTGESRGQFKIGPDVALGASENEPETVENPKASLDAEGPPAKATESSAKPTAGAAGDNGAGSTSPAAGSVVNSASSSTGPGPGIGQGSLDGLAPGSGSGAGPGSGAGSGAGSGVFPGISITGAATGSGTASGGTSPATPPVRTPPRPYDLTISATASSGGGLKDYGVFRNESVYTVYVDMSQADDPAPSWILQYAPLKRAAAKGQNYPGGITLGAADPPAQVVPPFALDKPAPAFPQQALSQNQGRLVVVYGVINTNGKLEQLRIIHSPDALLNQAVLEGLGNWTFKPAHVNGVPTAVKALIGIPLILPH
jgi:TonB family protein